MPVLNGAYHIIYYDEEEGSYFIPAGRLIAPFRGLMLCNLVEQLHCMHKRMISN